MSTTSSDIQDHFIVLDTELMECLLYIYKKGLCVFCLNPLSPKKLRSKLYLKNTAFHCTDCQGVYMNARHLIAKHYNGDKVFIKEYSRLDTDKTYIRAYHDFFVLQPKRKQWLYDWHKFIVFQEYNDMETGRILPTEEFLEAKAKEIEKRQVNV